jgi:hypothetical protein
VELLYSAYTTATKKVIKKLACTVYSVHCTLLLVFLNLSRQQQIPPLEVKYIFKNRNLTVLTGFVQGVIVSATLSSDTIITERRATKTNT